MTRRSGNEGLRLRSNAKAARISMMSTNFSHWNATFEPYLRVSRISASSPFFFLWLIRTRYNYNRNFFVFQENFHLTRRFIHIAEARGLLGREDKPYDRVRDTSFEVLSGICKSGLALISEENVEFFRQEICAIATRYGVEKLRYERHIDGGGPPVSDSGECALSEMELYPGDEFRLVTAYYGDVTRRFIVVYINKKQYLSEFAMIDKFVYEFV